MNSIIKLTPKQRTEVFDAATLKMGFAATAIVEKDFWVCWILAQLFSEEHGFGNHIVFKGGTSLSKAYAAIDRFSEDVDITIGRELLGFDTDEHDPEKAPSTSQRKKRIEALHAACSNWVADVLKTKLEAVTRSILGADGWSYEVDKRDKTLLTLLFHYPSVLPAATDEEYNLRAVKIECGAKADLWPVTEKEITPYVASAVPVLVKTATIKVQTLSLQRTFWEKATILHAEAHRPAEGKEPQEKYARHYADLAALSVLAAGQAALSELELLKRVVAFKEAFYPSKTSSYATAVPGTFKLLPAAAHAEHLEADYHKMRQMFFGPPLTWAEIIARLTRLEAQINGVKIA